ncbi:hypothetical protein ADIARSV_2790 [Arcticibacter svalbardensis MN12-7]|uniref:DUF4007 domain-containing protein n=1 Tax=Arcticibacter svalbardensis MN12-7 TaxID=1150600 RepID=R9GQF3_9SPHI|nr:DUF4007 family protein [Arcticibacter svalbardensis]EOR93956.1 hypothetical protein ADIARSV_2790 [Arcticibacter svalbardensis MN12-7]
MRISFSGHETFVCRQFWLKKGYEHLLAHRSFVDDDAVVHLGVGKNMTTAIKFWLRGFNIADDHDKITTFGDYVFSGKDPYLEDSASLWLLHYMVINNERVFIFNSFFNQFLKEKNEFTKPQLISFLKRKTEESGIKHFSDKTYGSDANVFLRTYNRANDGKADIEEETANLLVELNLIRPFTRLSLDGKTSIQWFKVIRESRENLPREILAYAIINTFGNEVQSLSFKDLLESVNSPGNIFCLTEKGLEEKLVELAHVWPLDFNYNETAGNRVFQIKRELDKWEFLNRYYG